jgi:hypothetical protein
LHLPDDVSYGEILCVAEFWKRQQVRAVPKATARPLSDWPIKALRQWRSQEAQDRDQPEYTILTDVVLRKIAQYRPQDLAELETLRVLDRNTLRNDGPAILEVIANAAQDTTVIDAILACVRANPNQLPRSGIAKVLVGSNAERMEGYQDNPFYNALHGHHRNDVLLQVDDLLDRKLLQADRSGYLTVRETA